MSYFDDRRVRLSLVLAVVGVVALYVLWEVVWTVFFALTFVYVLYPTRERLVEHGVSRRLAAGALTAVAAIGVLALFAPVAVVLYQRRSAIIDFFLTLPPTLDVSLGGFTYVVELQSLAPTVRSTLSNLAVAATGVAPVLLMKLFLFAFLVYALLYEPGGVRSLVFRAVGEDVRAELLAYHDRIRDTLYGLYFVQAATGVLTFVLALPVFYLLGYDAFFSLSVLSGIFQFVPIIGPSVVVVSLAAVEIAVGNTPGAVLVLVLGLVVVGLLPDAVLRPRLAKYSAGMPASLYFVGFLGGVFTVGPIGIIAGPLVLSILVQTVELVADGIDADRATAVEGAVTTETGAGADVKDAVDVADDPDDDDGTAPDPSAED